MRLLSGGLIAFIGLLYVPEAYAQSELSPTGCEISYGIHLRLCEDRDADLDWSGSPASAESPFGEDHPLDGPIATESLFSRDFAKLLWEDVRHVLSAPVRWEKQDWLTFSLATLGVGAVTLLDRSVRDAVQRNRNDTTDRVAKIVQPFGGEYSFGVLGGFYLTGAALDNANAKAVALDGLASSLIASGIISPVLRTTVGRSRPFRHEGVYTFRPFSFDSSHNSFPSGHATQAFAVASVIAAHYEPFWSKMMAYGIAASVGLARIERNAHFASDVAAGALIGTAVGHEVVGFNRQYRARISLGPLIDREAHGMAIAFSFP